MTRTKAKDAPVAGGMDETSETRAATAPAGRRMVGDMVERPVQIDARDRDDDGARDGDLGRDADSTSDDRAQPCAELSLEARVEALLIAAERPMPEARLAELLGLSGKGVGRQVVAAIDSLNQHYGQSGRAFRAERLAGGWQLLTRAEFGPLLHRMFAERQQSKLSQPALETLAIVAYRQPIMRAELEAIRGVASGEVLRSLLERRLIKIVGRAEELGRPMLYGTTREFLQVFGLASVDDLPPVKGLTEQPQRAQPVAEISEAGEAVDQTSEAQHRSADSQPADAPSSHDAEFDRS